MRQDKTKQAFDNITSNIDKGRFLSTQLNNELLKHYIDAKLNGGYERIQYDKIVGFQTLVKKSRNLSRIDRYFQKDLDKLDENDILRLRDDLNNDKITTYQTLVKWKTSTNGKKYPITKFKETNKPLSYRTKVDYAVNFREFYEFIIEYYRKEKQNELKDITKYFKIRRASDFNEIVVEFIPDNELITLLTNIHNRDFKALVQLTIMSAARPCEILKVKYGKSHNLYKNSKGEWIIHLPKVKRISYKKYPFKIDMYEEELIPYFEGLELREGDLVFKTTDTTFRKLMTYYTEKYLHKRYTPKILRKTARMIRTNVKYSHDWINKLMGHSPNSKVQAHYTNYDGIENDLAANDRLKNKQNPHLNERLQKLELELKAERERNKEQAQDIKKLTELVNFVFKLKQEG